MRGRLRETDQCGGGQLGLRQRWIWNRGLNLCIHSSSSAESTWGLDASSLSIVHFQVGFFSGARHEMRSSTEGRLILSMDADRSEAQDWGLLECSRSQSRSLGGRHRGECRNIIYFILYENSVCNGFGTY